MSERDTAFSFATLRCCRSFATLRRCDAAKDHAFVCGAAAHPIPTNVVLNIGQMAISVL